MRRTSDRDDVIHDQHSGRVNVQHGRPPSDAFAEVLAGLFLFLFGLLRVVSDGLPGLSILDGLLLVPPLSCLGVMGVVRARRHGLRSLSGWVWTGTAACTFVAVSSAMLLGLGIGSPVEQPAILAFVGGFLGAAGGTVTAGLLAVAGTAVPTSEGFLLAGWPVLSVVTLGGFVLLGSGSIVAALALPFGVGLAAAGGMRVARSRSRRAPDTPVEAVSP